MVCSGKTCAACGAANQPCCANATCSAAGTTCTNGLCIACGAAGDICCANDTCALATNVCSGGNCIVCGALGQRCCANRGCSASGTACAASAAGGADTCQPCGGAGEACGANNTCTVTGAECALSGSNQGTCQVCGGSGQACCSANRCSAGGCCWTTTGGGATCTVAGAICTSSGRESFTCAAGACVSGVVDGGTIPDGGGNRCGGLNDPCCSNIRCTAGNVVCHTNDTCVSCGKLGERYEQRYLRVATGVSARSHPLGNGTPPISHKTISGGHRKRTRGAPLPSMPIPRLTYSVVLPRV